MNLKRSSAYLSENLSDWIIESSLIECYKEDYRFTGEFEQAVDRSIKSESILNSLKGLELTHFLSRYPRGFEGWGRYKGTVLKIRLRRGTLTVDIFSIKADLVPVAQKAIEEELKHLKMAPEDGKIPIRFSYMGSHGPRIENVKIYAPSWKDVQENYSESVQDSVSSLISNKKPWETGQLIIWNGKPGTGKTYAIRALIHELHKTFNFLVVTDPEEFMRKTDYYLSVATEIREEDEHDSDENKNKHLMVIMEDSADLILQESRKNSQGSIGRFLNITDGLIGQGREDMFLISFNEDVDKIDPAFMRAGRCMSAVEFSPLDNSSVKEWLKKRNVDPTDIHEDMLLADLYALANKNNQIISKDEPLIGFSSGGGRGRKRGPWRIR